MASDLLTLGSQSVLTAQKQLNTTGHNISNVNTKGYSRQSVVQEANTPRMYGGSTFGMGVHVENVRRSWDKFATNELNLATTSNSNHKDKEEDLTMLSSMLSSMASKKIPDNMNEWFSAINTLADSPNELGSRGVVLEKARIVAETLNGFQETVRQQYDITNQKLNMGIKRINQLALEIRDVHRLMMRTPGPHNDLMDKHEKLIRELSKYTKVTVTPRSNGEGYNVHIGNGNTLVSGAEASQLKMVDGYPDVHQRRLAIVEGKALKPVKSDDLGGKLGAMMDMRDKEIPHVLDELGRMATAYAYQINKLQKQGLDMRGDIGGLIFNDVNSQATAKSRVITASKSQVDAEVYIEDLSQLKGGEYKVHYDGSDYRITKPDGTSVVVEPSNDEFTIDGLRVHINNPPQEGERFLIRPTREGASQFKVMTDDPQTIAAQSYEASTSFAQGTAKFNIQQAGDLREFEVLVSPKGDQFAVLDTKGNVVRAPAAYPPKGPVSVTLPSSNADYKTGKATVFELSGGALPNDRFTANLVPSPGDNGNLIKMQNVQTNKALDNNESTIFNVYNNLNTNVGLRTSTASRLADIARIENEQAESRVASISGVNLDEEAANLMRFQQAYMASSRIIQASNDTFNSILALK